MNRMEQNTGKRALVVGLGIAGMSAAVGLRKAGWTPMIVERSPERRTGGYFVGLFADGKRAAQDLGVMKHLHTRNPASGTEWSIDRHGRHHEWPGFLDQPGDPAAVMRGDIEAALWHSLQEDAELEPVEVWFGARPLEIIDQAGAADVVLEDVATGERRRETFDLVVGADGLRSSVRALVFGPHEEFMESWNAIICAFELDEQVPGYGPQDGVIVARAGRAAWTFGFSDRTPTMLLTYRTDDEDAQFERPPVETLEAAFDGLDHPVVAHGLQTLRTAPHYLFDSVHQVKMPTWHRGRVVLVGDSAWCLNLFSGMGSTAGLEGGAALGKALMDYPEDLDAALAAWEEQMQPPITAYQKRAQVGQHLFVPTGRISEAVRNTALRTMAAINRLKSRRSGTDPGTAPSSTRRGASATREATTDESVGNRSGGR
jgi:2-polyprenyl-6-methoxyphenol hydroxylase-like FAD-dependent oxidoreductase